MKTKKPSRVLQALGKLRKAADVLNANVLERERETEGIMLAILSGTSAFFIGEPGTGKTHQIRLATQLLGLTSFDTLISETTKPDSIFGPPDIPALAKGTQRSKIDGYAPTQEVLFFDEIFKATGIVLNPLLWLVNEHQYRNGDDGIVKCPTKAVFAASNEIPTDPSLAAIYDRFILRYHVKYLRSKDNLNKMLDTTKQDIKTILSRDDVELLRKVVDVIDIPPDIRDAVFSLRDQITRGTGVLISDRRLMRAFRIIQAKALMRGSRTANMSDLQVLCHVFWNTVEQIPKVRALVMNMANAKLSDITAYEDLAEELWQKALKTGDLDDAENRLREIYKSLKGGKSDIAKEVASKIKDYVLRIKAIKERRNDFVIMQLLDADNKVWFKLSSACESFWSEKQLRSVRFRWRRKASYWWMEGPKKGSTVAFRAKLIKTISTKLGVTPTFVKTL